MKDVTFTGTGKLNKHITVNPLSRENSLNLFIRFASSCSPASMLNNLILINGCRLAAYAGMLQSK